MPAGSDGFESFATWRLDGLIAVGGTAEVWRATRGGETAALKRMHTHLQRIEEARALFETESILTRSLPPHPGVVRAIEAGNLDGRPYLALELVPGEVLRQIVAPAATRAVAIVAAVCDAAAHLHDAGWIHGDINPGNVIVGDRVVLIDLGVARRAGEGGAVRGTHAYMAPEQVRGEVWTPATDVFALGVVLWELLAGKRLFHRGPTWLSAAAVIESAAPPLADPTVDAIVQAALAKDPAARIPTAAELAARLRA